MKIYRDGEALVLGRIFATFCRQGCRRFEVKSAMRGVRSCAAAVVLCLVCGVPFASAGEKEAGEEVKKWTHPGPIPPPSVPDDRGRVGRALVEVGEIVTIDENTVILRPNAEGVDEPRRLQVGDKVFVGDRILVGAESSAEVTLGLNARLRVGANSVVRILDKTEYPKTDDNVVVTKRDMELTRGSARLRVRQNRLTPSPVLIISGDAQLMLQRADAVLSREEEEKDSTVMVLGGQAEVRVRARTDSGLEQIEKATVAEGEKVAVKDGVLREVPLPVRMSEQEMDSARGQLGFTVDEQLKRRPPPPRHDADIDGP